MSYAGSSATGRLPAPYTGGGSTKTIYDTTNTDIGAALIQTGINTSEINDDGTSAKNVRVYQLLQDISQTVPLYFQSGPSVNILYDYGAIYLTACPKTTIACNPAPATGIPGSSTELTVGTMATWTTTGTDGTPTLISSMPIQKQMLATTSQRLDKVRDTLLGYFRAQQQIAAGGDTTNWFPNQSGAAAPGSKTGQAPGGSQQGCRDGWYDLSSTTESVLSTVGLAYDEFGKTAWGGPIQYCRDYDPAVTAPNTTPHYAAIRINKNVTTGAAPTNTPGDNIVLTF